MAGFFGILVFAILILFAIFFHELGHFVTARWAGIKVSKFFIGFGPTLWSTRRGRLETVTGSDGVPITRPETEYGVKALPLGGFVKIVGMSPMEELAPEEEPRAFPAAPASKRAIVLAAGSFTHFITAFLVLWLVFTAVGIPDRPTLEVRNVVPTIGDRPSPAASSGMRDGDQIVEVNGKPVRVWQEVGERIRAREGKPVSIAVVRDGRRRTFEIAPVVERLGDERVPIVGIEPGYQLRRQNPVVAIGSSGRAMVSLLQGFFSTVPRAFSPSSLGLTGGGPTNERPFSIIGAGKIAGDLASQGSILDFMLLFVQINVFIGLFNLLPLPPLDGGHLIVLLIEKIRRKPISPRAIVPVAAVVFSVIVLLGVLLMYYDIVQPPRLPGR